MAEPFEMKLGDAGASVAVSLAAYGVMFGMNPFDAVSAAEGVLRASCEQYDEARGKKTIRMLGTVPVVEVMVAMGKVIDAEAPLRQETVTAPEPGAEPGPPDDGFLGREGKIVDRPPKPPKGPDDPKPPKPDAVDPKPKGKP